jgi:hypothetical protein
MAITTYATFTAGLAALSVTGVSRKFSNPPASIGTADLPAMWPGLPRGNEAAMTFDGGGGWPEYTCDLVIAVEPTAQNTQAGNYANMITVLDNLCTALRAAAIGKTKLNWDITANAQVDVAGITYWAVIATVTGHG